MHGKLNLIKKVGESMKIVEISNRTSTLITELLEVWEQKMEKLKCYLLKIVKEEKGQESNY